MANAFYTTARMHFAQGDLHWKTGGDTFRAVLIDTGAYTVDIGTHEYLSSVPAIARIATANLTTLTATDGCLDAANVTFTAVAGSTSCEAIVIYQWTGSDATSILLLYLDEASAGLPVTPAGDADIAVTWDNGTEKIAKL